MPPYLSFFNIGGRDAFLQPFVEGRLWHDKITVLSATENAALWQQLGEFARTLHDEQGEAFGFPLPCERFPRWSLFIADYVAGLVEDCRQLGIMSAEIEIYQRQLPYFFGELDKVQISRLLHGDLWPRNVIIDGQAEDIRITAVIDGERAFWGDPLSDWVLILYGVPDEFWQGYGENLLATAGPVRVAIYKGMYFILNALEASRSGASIDAARDRLATINEQLGDLA